MQILERIYFEWCQEMKDSSAVDEAMKKLSSFNDQLRESVREDYYRLDEAIMDLASESQKQGFMAGFEVAKQLFLGGSVK